MNAIQFELGGGASIALPADKVASALIARLQESSKPSRPRYQIGQYAPGQGGIYAGDILGSDGVLYGLIIGDKEDVGTAKWGPDGEQSLSDWDGLTNTNHLRVICPAAKLASRYEADGHVDFYLPGRREMLVAMANVPHLFGKKSWYWTSTPCGSRSAWSVEVESGDVRAGYRGYGFRVRPFRRFTY